MELQPSSPIPAPPNPWDRLPHETSAAFALFSAYLAQGTARSLTAVAEEARAAKGKISRFSVKFRWAERILAWENHLAALRTAKIEEISIAALVNWADRGKELRENEFQAASEALVLCRRILAKIMKGHLKGRTSIQDAARLLEIASKVGRLATGLATERSELTGADGDPIRLEVSAAIAKVYGTTIDLPPNTPLDTAPNTPQDFPSLPAPPTPDGL